MDFTLRSCGFIEGGINLAPVNFPSGFCRGQLA
jgi:hypothetical protein